MALVAHNSIHCFNKSNKNYDDAFSFTAILGLMHETCLELFLANLFHYSLIIFIQYLISIHIS